MSSLERAAAETERYRAPLGITILLFALIVGGLSNFILVWFDAILSLAKGDLAALAGRPAISWAYDFLKGPGALMAAWLICVRHPAGRWSGLFYIAAVFGLFVLLPLEAAEALLVFMALIMWWAYAATFSRRARAFYAGE